MPAMQDAVWRTFDAQTSFRWSGANDHRERLRAAYRLYKTFTDIIASDRDARIHVVAHSHGGNVLLRAIEILLDPFPESRREITMRDLWRGYLRDYPWLLRRFKLEGADPVVTASEDAIFRNGAQHLGRLVFLGTPFVRKQWTPPSSPKTRLLKRLAGNLAGAVTGAAVTLYAIALLLSAFAAATPWVSFIGANPLRWPFWWQFGIGTAAIVYCIIILLDEARYNSNLYFAEHRDKRQPPVPFPALVVSASFLDEALLGLSAEPLVVTELAPRIEDLFHPERSWPLHKLFALRARLRQHGPIGVEELWVEDAEIGTYWASFSIFKLWPRALSRLVFDCAYYPLSPLWKFVQNCLSQRASHLVRDSLAAGSFGLPGSDLSGARLEISPHIKAERFFAEEFWEVSRMALETPIVVSTAARDRKRFAYILDDDALKDRLKTEEKDENGPWSRLKQNLGGLYERYASSFVFEVGGAGQLSRAEYDRAIGRIWLTTVERIREVSGAIELAHSAYYANPVVEEGIANFIATGSRHCNYARAVIEFISEGNPNVSDE
jgi:hypothetical protein